MKTHKTRQEKASATAEKREGFVRKLEKKSHNEREGNSYTDIVSWLHSVNVKDGRFQQRMSRLDPPDRLIFKNSARRSFSKSLPAVFAVRQENAGKIFFSGSAIAKDLLERADLKSSKSFCFASYLSHDIPPLHFGSIDDMKIAGLNKHFISMLLRPEQYAGEDKESILETKVFYSVLADESPLSEQLRPFSEEVRKTYANTEIKTGLNELLITASSLENFSLAKLLLYKGADPNARSWSRGVSAINVANNNQRKKTAQMLIDFGADPRTPETYPMSDAPRNSKKFADSGDEFSDGGELERNAKA